MDQNILNVLGQETTIPLIANETLEVIKLLIELLSAVIIPIVIWIVGNKISNIRQLEEKLRDDKIEIYNKVLEPFFLMFSTPAVIQSSFKSKHEKQKTGADLSSEKILSLDYQEFAFKLSLLGSDKVVRAYNNLMQAFYNSKQLGDNSGLELIKYTSVLLLEVRKDLGNSNSKLHEFELLEWKINDIRNRYLVKGMYPNMQEYHESKQYIDADSNLENEAKS